MHYILIIFDNVSDLTPVPYNQSMANDIGTYFGNGQMPCWAGVFIPISRIIQLLYLTQVKA